MENLAKTIVIAKGLLPRPEQAHPPFLSIACLTADQYDSWHKQQEGTLSIAMVWQQDCSLKIYFLNETTTHTLTPVAYQHGFLVPWPEACTEAYGQPLPLLHTACDPFDRSPFWEEHESPPQGMISVPAFGLIGGLWRDGWAFQSDKKANFLTLIPPGWPYAWAVALGEDLREGLPWAEAIHRMPPLVELHRSSLICFIRHQISALEHVQADNMNLKEAIELLLLRQAFSSASITVYNPQKKKLWPAHFKNFLDSIGAVGKQGITGVNLESIFAPISTDLLLSLAERLNQPTRILAGFRGEGDFHPKKGP